MVLAYHVIFTAYGFWLPNDPRGSWSDFVRSWELFRFGRATKVDTRRSVASVPHDRRRREAAKAALRYPPVTFTGLQARAIGRGFAEAVQVSGYDVYACAILPEHVHMVIGRHRYRIEQVVRRLKQAATERLAAEQLHPMAEAAGEPLPSPWARKCWKVFLDRLADIERVVRYVEDNPVKEGKKRQRWSFVRSLRGGELGDLRSPAKQGL